MATTFPASILLVIPNLGLGGAQRVLHDHSVELARHYDVTEVVFNLDEGNMYPSTNKLISLDVRGGGSPLTKMQNFWYRIAKLKKVKQQLHTTVCISHLEGADYINLLSKGSEKVVLCVHGSKLHDANINGPIGWLRKKILIPALYNRADRIVTVSRDIIPELIEGFGVKPEKLLTINNFFEVSQIAEKAQEALTITEQAVYNSAPVLVTSGRLAPQKNQAPLLTVFASLLKRQTAKLVFIGDGELREALVAQARTLGLRTYAVWETDNSLTSAYDVYFFGLQKNPFKYLRPASLFVFPSAWEGFPMALGEAMSCGLAVVSTDCPTGPREMLAPATKKPLTPLRHAESGTYGMLLPMLTQPATLANDITVWVDTLVKLLANDDARNQLAKLAQERIQDFTRERIFKQWIELVEELQKN